jgi:glutathione S-transferase
MQVTLHLAPGASSMAPHIALVEADARFEIRPLSFKAKEHRSPEYLAINPQGLVPTLVVDGLALTESLAILFWIGRQFPDAGLLPRDNAGEAQVLGWMSFLASSVQRAGREGAEAGHAAYAMVERKLAGREWTVGDRMSVADIHLFRM